MVITVLLDKTKLEFEKIIADIEAGIVKWAIIKDISRFDRDYLQAGMYTEIMFPEHDIHLSKTNRKRI